MTARLVSLLALAVIGCAKNTNGTPDTDVENNDVVYVDSDGDTIIDLHEGAADVATGEAAVDTDADGTPDYLDTDSDNDTIPDSVEAGDAEPLTIPWDTDTDGTPDYRDDDSDGNCILDAEEATIDLDVDGFPDAADLDDDGDGIKDIYEIGAECGLVDSDGDGTADFHDDDSDADGVGDRFEGGTSPWQEEPVDTDGDGTADYLDADSDGDGLDDASESGVTDPASEPNDTDGDGLYDCADTDSDGDSLSDYDETFTLRTDAYDTDSDDDGFSDGAEMAAGSDPKDEGSVVEGLYVVVEERTSVEQDFSFELNVQMGDIGFLIDTTCSMGGTISGMKTEYGALVRDISAVLPDAQYGVATFDDYAYGGYGSTSSSDKPFYLLQQVTGDTAKVQTSLTGIGLHGGSDGPEGCMEALYQGLSGAGYDQNCNGNYNANTDVQPFIASGSDPFGGGGGEARTSSTGGEVGGFGFRPYALPILVYATDNYMRDPEAGYGTPGGCPGDAAHSDVVASAKANNAYLIGISVSGSLPVPQMNKLAKDTGSLADTDGDGFADDNLVFTWTGSSATLRKTIVDAIKNLVGSVRFSSVSLRVANDPYGFVTDISPESIPVSGDVTGLEVDFSLTFRGVVSASSEDRVYKLTLDVLGDDTVLLDTLDIYVLVPGGP